MSKRQIKRKLCEFENCTTLPNFGYINEKPQFCFKHKLENMINLTNTICNYDRCLIKSQSYDYEGGRGQYCFNHKLPGMINVKDTICKFPGCSIISPSFGNPNGKREYCSEHRLDGMIDLATKKCIFIGCITTPTYDIPGGKGIYCTKHKSDGMINVRDKRCEYNGCEKLNPTYDVPGGKGRFCAMHKEENMENIKNKRCIEKDCSIFATYGSPGQSKSHCARHRTIEMIRRPNARCIICKAPAMYGENGKLKHCEVHKVQCEQNIIEKTCISCGLPNKLNDDNKCTYCDTSNIIRVKNKKENSLMQYLTSEKLAGSQTDKTIDGGICGKERPDRVFELVDKIIILECDEEQHSDRNPDCEKTRMINISQSYGGIPVYFIRFNPDRYTCDNKRCESIHRRYNTLVTFIKGIIDNADSTPNALLSVIYLYYDNWKGIKHTQWQIIIPFELIE